MILDWLIAEIKFRGFLWLFLVVAVYVFFRLWNKWKGGERRFDYL